MRFSFEKVQYDKHLPAKVLIQKSHSIAVTQDCIGIGSLRLFIL